MPRHARLDAPDTLHHVMVRGIERTLIFRADTDRTDFLTRLVRLVAQGAWTVYAWALLPNHAHLLIRTAASPLAAGMRRLLAGYVVNFNRRYKRVGHLFQNRYKSIVVEEEPYLSSSSGTSISTRFGSGWSRTAVRWTGIPGPVTVPFWGPFPPVAG